MLKMPRNIKNEHKYSCRDLSLSNRITTGVLLYNHTFLMTGLPESKSNVLL